MKLPIVRLAALVALVSPPSGPAGDPIPPDLEFASVSVTDGIVGGIVGPTPRVVFAAAFDRVERGFRAWRQKDDPAADELWVADLTPEQFRSLLELAVSSGLVGLPLESPPSCMDVYGRRRQIRLDYGDVHWVNGAPGGCISRPSKVVPSEDQCRTFDRVVDRLKQAIDALPLRRAGRFDRIPIPFLEDAHASETYRRVLKHVLADPLRDQLDLERVRAWANFASFSWRGRRSEADVDNDVRFSIAPSGVLVRYPSSGDNLDRFEPVETGMTLEEVVARLGQPDEREQRPDGSLVLTYLPSQPALPRSLLPARLRFEKGRLSPP